MKSLTSCFFALATTFSAASFSGSVPEALNLTEKDLAGAVLEGQAIKKYGPNDAQYVEIFKSADKKLNVGVFGLDLVEEESNSKRYDNFDHNEIMFFIEGRMTLTDDNGKVVSAGPGEFLLIPKGWSGVRVTTDIRKVSVVYKD